MKMRLTQTGACGWRRKNKARVEGGEEEGMRRRKENEEEEGREPRLGLLQDPV